MLSDVNGLKEMYAFWHFLIEKGQKSTTSKKKHVYLQDIRQVQRFNTFKN